MFGQALPNDLNCTPSDFVGCNQLCNPDMLPHSSCPSGSPTLGTCFCPDFIGWSCLYGSPDYNNMPNWLNPNPLPLPANNMSGWVWPDDLANMTPNNLIAYGESFRVIANISAGESYQLSFYRRTGHHPLGLGSRSEMNLEMGFGKNSSLIGGATDYTPNFINSVPHQVLHYEEDVPHDWERVDIIVQAEDDYDYLYFIPMVDLAAYNNCCETAENGCGTSSADCGNCLFVSKVELNTIECCEENAHFDFDFYSVHSIAPQVWTDTSNPFGQTGPIKIKGFLEFPENSDVTIQGMTFEFGLNGVIYVRKGARLNLVNCILQGNTECETMWQGIRVIGPGAGNPQTATNSGEVVLNNSRIVDAVVGISTMIIGLFNMNDVKYTVQPDLVASQGFDDLNHIVLQNISDPNWNSFTQTSDPNWDNAAYITGGGRVSTYNDSGFQDCFYGLAIANYDGTLLNQNQTVGPNGTSFVSSGSMRYPFNKFTDRTEAGIWVQNLLGPTKLSVYGCTFDNVKSGVFAANVADSFIYGSNLFTNSSRGIYMLNTNTAFQCRVFLNDFEDCIVGIQADATDLITWFNDFDGQGPLINPLDVGILTRGCEFEIGNTIPTLGNTFDDLHIGNMNLQTPKSRNFVINNDFTNIGAGVAGGGKASDFVIWCNEFTSHFFAGVGVVEWGGQVGQLGAQGTCNNANTSDRPAANTFSQGVFYDIVIGNNANPFWYSDFMATSLNTNTIQTPFLVNCTPPDEGYCSNLLLAKSAIANLSDEDEITNEVTKWYYYHLQNEEDADAMQILEDYKNTAEGVKKKLLPHKVKVKDWATAQTMLNSLSIHTTEDQHFYDYYDLMIDLGLSNRDIYSLTTVEKNLIQSIAQSSTALAFNAKTVLYLVDGTYEVVTIPEFSNSSNKHATNVELEKKQVEIIPNPATNKAMISFELLENQEGILNIYDLSGRVYEHISIRGKGKQSLDLSKYENGIYFYTVEIGGNILQRKKLMIIK